MKATKLKRVLAVMGMVTAAGIVPLVTAAPAHASQARCVNFLGNQGYVIGPRVREACSYEALTGGLPNPNCVLRLTRIGVTGPHIQTACGRA